MELWGKGCKEKSGRIFCALPSGLAGKRMGGRAVEGARLESVCTSKAYRGFESHPIRQYSRISAAFRGETQTVPSKLPSLICPLSQAITNNGKRTLPRRRLPGYPSPMTDLSDTTTRADHLLRVRDLLAAIRREAGHKGMTEVVELAEQAEAVTAEMIRREAN